MTIQRGDCVRPNNPRTFLPRDSVWRVACSAGALKLEPENSSADRVGRWATYAQRFNEHDFDKVVLCRGQWVAVNDTDCQNLPETQTSTVSSAEAKRQLAARLHADRCLGEAELALIAEVSRLNNGGAEQIAAASIAAHVDQLQALAKSYGYRIAKPGVLAIVVKA